MNEIIETVFEPDLISPDTSDDLLIPFGAVLRGGVLTISYPSRFEPAARQAASLGDPFDERVRDGIAELFDPPGRGFGFRTEVTSTCVYTVPRGYDPDVSLIREDTRRIDCAAAEKLIVDLEELPDTPFFGTVMGRHLVSAACLNRYPAGEGFEYDLWVETCSEFENMGCATSNVVSLCRDAAGKNRYPTYISETDNPGSMRVAEKAGLKLCAKEMRVIWFR